MQNLQEHFTPLKFSINLLTTILCIHYEKKNNVYVKDAFEIWCVASRIIPYEGLLRSG